MKKMPVKQSYLSSKVGNGTDETLHIKRDEKFDFFKGLLMVGVVLGHVLNAIQGEGGKSFWIHEFVRTYDMPMFAFITGIFIKKSCNKRGVIQNIILKIKGLLYPAILWSLIFALPTGSLVPNTGGLWFLYSIFISSVIIILIDQIKMPALKFSCFAIVIIAFHILINEIPNRCTIAACR